MKHYTSHSALYTTGYLLFSLYTASAAYAGPQGGVVSAGQAHITQSPGQVTIQQTTEKAVIDWRSFDIDTGERAVFNQPGRQSSTLNRIHDNAPSQIHGTLSANGNVVLVNPHGVVFGSNAKVDVGGLVATTADTDNRAFMAGAATFDTPGKPDAAIVNHGEITAKEAGLVGLVAPNVVNHGVINARLGKVQLASGDRFTLDMHGDGLTKIAVSDDVTSQIVGNTGSVRAEGGSIALTAAAGRAAVNNLIYVEGELRAPSIKQHAGKIVIAAEGSNAVSGNDTTQKGTKTGTSYVTTSNALLDISGRKAGVRGGELTIIGDDIALTGQTVIDASGTAPVPVAKPVRPASDTSSMTADSAVKTNDTFLADARRGGGSIKIGGDYLGRGDTPAATRVHVSANTLIANDGLEHGDGGRTIIWSDDTTDFYGSVFARGGAKSGHGGFLETSGKRLLAAHGAADLTATEGFKRGTYLLDPDTITIYGEVDEDFVSSDGSIDLDSSNVLQLDATNPANVVLTFSTDALGGATATGNAGENEITTDMDVSSHLAVGARIRLGTNGAVTTADTLGAHTYTIASIAGQTITLEQNLSQNYTASDVYRGLVSELRDSSGTGAHFTQAVEAHMPLWSRSADLNNQYTLNHIRDTGAEDYLRLAFGASGWNTLDTNLFKTGDYWLQTTSLTRGGGAASDGANNTQAIFIRRGYHSGLIYFGFPDTTALQLSDWEAGNISRRASVTAASNTPNISGGGVVDNTATHQLYVSLNGELVSGPVAADIEPNAGPFYVGTANNSGSGFPYHFDGVIPEVSAYSTYISDDAKTLLNQYQSAKYDIALDTPGTGGSEAAQAMSATGYSVFSTRYLERLSETANIDLRATNDVTLDLQGDVLDLANNRSITLTSDNTNIITASDGTIRTSGTGDITMNATSGNIQFYHDMSLDAGGAITLNARYIINNADLAIASTEGALFDSAFNVSNTGKIDVTSNDLTLDSSNYILNGNIQGAGNLLINNADSVGSSSAKINDPELNKLQNGWNSITFADDNSDLTVNNTAHQFRDPIIFASSGHNIIVDDQLEAATGSDASFTFTNGSGGAASGVQINGSIVTDGGNVHFDNITALTLGDDITTNGGNINVADSVAATTLNGSVVLDAHTGTVAVGTSGLNTQANAFSLHADELTLDGALTGTGALTLAPSTTGRALNIGQAGTAGLDVSTAELARIGTSFSDVTFGDANTGALSMTGWSPASNLTLHGASVSLTGAVDVGTNTATVNAASGAIDTQSFTITADSIALDAATSIDADINATALDIGTRATGATITGLLQGLNNQVQANKITGGPGNDPAYLFNDKIIRLTTAPVTPVSPVPPTDQTDLPDNEPTIPVTPDIPTVDSNDATTDNVTPNTSRPILRRAVPNTVELVSQTPPVTSSRFNRSQTKTAHTAHDNIDIPEGTLAEFTDSDTPADTGIPRIRISEKLRSKLGLK